MGELDPGAAPAPEPSSGGSPGPASLPHGLCCCPSRVCPQQCCRSGHTPGQPCFSLSASQIPSHLSRQTGRFPPLRGRTFHIPCSRPGPCPLHRAHGVPSRAPTSVLGFPSPRPPSGLQLPWAQASHLVFRGPSVSRASGLFGTCGREHSSCSGLEEQPQPPHGGEWPPAHTHPTLVPRLCAGQRGHQACSRGGACAQPTLLLRGRLGAASGIHLHSHALQAHCPHPSIWCGQVRAGVARAGVGVGAGL